MKALNKNGKTLGRKGNETRERLILAAQQIMQRESLAELTAMAIAKEAGTVSSTFYIYFKDLRDLLYALSERASADLKTVLEVLSDPIDDPDQFAHRFVRRFHALWQQHRYVFRIRNLEADQGDPRFDALHLSTAIPIIMAMCDRILDAHKGKSRLSRRRVNAWCVNLYQAMESLAGTTPAAAQAAGGVDVLLDAQAEILAMFIRQSALGQPEPTAQRAGPAREKRAREPADRPIPRS